MSFLTYLKYLCAILTESIFQVTLYHCSVGLHPVWARDCGQLVAVKTASVGNDEFLQQEARGAWTAYGHLDRIL
jgi:hypothetical protein